jgi:predicted negative regulator of RcsB-dependent stress response
MTKTGEAATPRLDLDDDETLVEALQRNQRPLTIGVIVLAVAIGGWWMMKRSAEIRESRAAQALAGGEGAYAAGNAPLAQAEFEKVVTRYAGTSAGTQAGLLSAQLYFEAGHVDSGMTRLDQVLPKAPKHLKAGVLAHRAAGHALAGRPAEAAAAYEQASAAARMKQEKEQYRMDAARQHVQAGNIEAARTIYTELAGREDSAHSSEARLRLGELTLKV